MRKFLNEYEKRRKRVDSFLRKYIELKNVSSPLREAMRYTIEAGGKRFRPVICYEGYRICGGKKEEEVMPPACACEIIHTFTLIHDDLPAIDDDDLRRGKPTLHKVFGEDIAILTGDALFIYGIELFLKAKSEKEKIFEALQVLVSSLGIGGVIEGEVLDVKSIDKSPDEKYVWEIHSKKTAKFISACLEIGAIFGGANEKEREIFKRAGFEMGMAYQIQDDILDVIGEKEKLGKSVRKDENKMTYVKVYGLEKAKKIAKSHSENAKKFLEKLPYDVEFLMELCDFIVEREY